MRWRLLVASALAVALVTPAGARGATPASGSMGLPSRNILGLVPVHSPSGRVARPYLQANPLIYHGSSVMRTNQTYAVYWDPASYTMSANYRSIIDGYLQNVAAASGTTGNVYATDTEYYDTSGTIAYSSTFGGSVTDTTPISVSSTNCGSVHTNPCLTDNDVVNELRRVMQAQGWTGGSNKVFFIMTPYQVDECYNSSNCSYSTFCGYHSGFWNGTWVFYAYIPYPVQTGNASGCITNQYPNGDEAADSALSIISHEHNESITDPDGGGWFDASGNEDGDKCAWNFGASLGGANGAHYNQIINGHHYYLQQEWSNNLGCVQQEPASGSTSTPTNTLTATPTRTSTPTQPQTSTATPGQTATRTNTPTSTATSTASSTDTPTSTATNSASPTDTATPPPTATPTYSATNSPTSTATSTGIPTNTPSDTAAAGTLTPTAGPSSTPTMVAGTATPADTVTDTATIVAVGATATNTSAPTATQGVATATTAPTATTVPTQAIATPTSMPTATSVPTRATTPTAVPTATRTVAPTQTPRVKPTRTPRPTPTQTHHAAARVTATPAIRLSVALGKSRVIKSGKIKVSVQTRKHVRVVVLITLSGIGGARPGAGAAIRPGQRPPRYSMRRVFWTDYRGRLAQTFVLRPHVAAQRPVLLRIAVQTAFGRASFNGRVVFAR